MDVPITKPIDIHPVNIIDAPWAGAEIQKHRALASRQKVAQPAFLKRDRIPDSDSKKVYFPPRDGQEAVTEKKR
jgi:hypothetical protein